MRLYERLLFSAVTSQYAYAWIDLNLNTLRLEL